MCRSREPRADGRQPRLPILGIVAAAALALAAPAAAQVRFEMPDPAVHPAHYTTVDDCLALTGRVRDSVLATATVWRDSVLVTPASAREPLAAPVLETARRCSAPFTAAAAQPAAFTSTLQLFLLAGRDADAWALLQHRLDAVKPTAPRERAGVLDTALRAYLGKNVVRNSYLNPVLTTQPVRVEAADSVLGMLDRALAKSTDDSLRHELIAAHDLFMTAARDAGDTARAIAAARHIVTFAHTVAAETRSKDVHETVQSTSAALELLSWPELLDSLRHGTAGYVARVQADWAKASGERPESYSRFQPAGAVAPPIEADFWFRRADSTVPRPTRGKVALVVFIDQLRCASQNCFAEYATLHRLAQRYPELEITLLARTHGYLSDMAPPPPAEEAERLRRFWLDERQLPGALAVHTTSFWWLPEPDHRRVDHDDPNDERYQFHLAFRGTAAFERAILVDRNGVVVDDSYIAGNSGELRLYQLIDAVFAQPTSARTATR
ncbi:MAG TPA: hypothetical protein VF041_18910 [Gemmatimonadaceae bacterium]